MGGQRTRGPVLSRFRCRRQALSEPLCRRLGGKVDPFAGRPAAGRSGLVEHINKDRYRQMSQVEQWLQANKDQLAEIVRRSDASPDLVHLVAVLVLGGLTDAQIHKQLGLVE